MRTILYLSLCCGILTMLSSCNTSETTSAQQIAIVDAVFASGHIIMENEYLVTANSEGYLVAAPIQEGDSVNAGMPLFQLSSEVQNEQLSGAQATYQDALKNLNENSPQQSQLRLQIEQAKAQLEIDAANYKRYQNLSKTGAVSQQELERAKVQYENSSRQVDILQKSLSDLVEKLRLNLINAETQLNIQKENTNDYYLSSFIDGRVLEVYKNQGDLVRRGETIARIGGGKPLVKLFVGEEDIDKIKVGQLTTISLNTQKDDLLDARISKIYPAFDELQQSFICEAAFVEAPKLFVNTQLQANIIIAQKENALVIPGAYLLPGDSICYKNGEKEAVKVGIRTSDWVEIISGLDQSRLIKQMKKP
ncbi:efflux RND transporter periplasmic adaptor subunit [Cognataquiflexum rubidum]|uniref:efflux RND transporter periplasmic adaptor subunit n=1 Tax=Cognataquiflexum rubidum TaxID=2922273 RepID=UPI001F133EC8|nr:efflux RND transporter periplasmic adaptor subunit [Cognataquiflexum rubidum]MCH6236031.1 efflux RND transporter periplasmic adaptor subunit [Cognataquiflexum rubidum]